MKRTCANPMKPVRAWLSATAASAASPCFCRLDAVNFPVSLPSRPAGYSGRKLPRGRTPSSCGRPTEKTAILRAVQAVSLCSTACPSSQIANSHRYRIFSWLRLQKNGDPCGLNLLSGLFSWSSADGVRGASPPFDCRPLGRPLGARAPSVERLPHPSPRARGAAAVRLAPAHKSVRRFPFRSQGSLQRRGSAPDAAGQLALLADGRRCRVVSVPRLRRVGPAALASTPSLPLRVFRSSSF